MHIHYNQVTKDALTYNIDYSLTLYGYNAITASMTLTQSACTSAPNYEGTASGSFTVNLYVSQQCDETLECMITHTLPH